MTTPARCPRCQSEFDPSAVMGAQLDAERRQRADESPVDDIKLLSDSPRPCVVVVGVPQCWVDVSRVAQLLARPPSNDNGHHAVAAGRAK